MVDSLAVSSSAFSGCYPRALVCLRGGRQDQASRKQHCSAVVVMGPGLQEWSFIMRAPKPRHRPLRKGAGRTPLCGLRILQ